MALAAQYVTQQVAIYLYAEESCALDTFTIDYGKM